MILFEDRASTVLYKVLSKIKQKKFLLPLNVCPIVPDTFLRANKEFEFVDIEFETLCMNQELVIQKIKSDMTIDGILFVKTFGIEFDIQPFYKKLKSLNKELFIIDDMCPSIQEFNYDIENSYADIALFSSGYSKYVDIGYGGYGFLKNIEFQTIFRDKSNDKDFLKYKEAILDEIKLMKIHKQELNNIYKKNISKRYHLGEKFNNWRFSILIEDKDILLEKIFKIDGLFASNHYPQIDYDYVKSPMKNSNTKKIHNNIINLFNDFRFTKEKAYKITAIINKHINKG